MSAGLPGQGGVALVVVLMLVAIASLLAATGMGQAIVTERVAGNQRQVTGAFFAAEAGMFRVASWWDETDSGVPNHQRYWNDPDAAITELHELDTSAGEGLSWSVQHLDFTGDTVAIVIRGRADTGGAAREIRATYRRPVPEGQRVLAPVNFAGGIGDYAASGLRAAEIDADTTGGQPAIVTATEADAQRLREVLSPEELAALGGEVGASATGFSDPSRVQAFVEALARVPGVYDGPAPWDFGTPEDPVVALIRGVDGRSADLQLRERLSGAGVLVVTGALVLDQVPEFTGLLLVLGDRVEIGPGSGAINGGLVLHHIDDPGAREWSAALGGIDFYVGGDLEIASSGDALEGIPRLLSSEALSLWEGLVGAPSAPRTGGGLSGWMEVPGL